jgi:hypothetical protein
LPFILTGIFDLGRRRLAEPAKLQPVGLSCRDNLLRQATFLKNCDMALKRLLSELTYEKFIQPENALQRKYKW